MQRVEIVTGQVCPLQRNHVDTDAIVPKQYLKSVSRQGFGEYLFDQWRFLDSGKIGMQACDRKQNPEFVLNFPRYQNSKILLAGENFGCGSSREHAAWALSDYGFRVIIAQSFADIFWNNGFKNGLLLICLTAEKISSLFDEVLAASDYEVTVDLVNQHIILPSKKHLGFEIEAFRKERLLKGLDDIGVTLQQSERIKAFEAGYYERYPWLR